MPTNSSSGLPESPDSQDFDPGHTEAVNATLKVSKPLKKSRAPEPASGLNVNFCKSPSCANFGIPLDSLAPRKIGVISRYTVVGAGKNLPSVRCNSCGEHFPLKSNYGIFEEFWRISSEIFSDRSCPEQSCSNHRVGISAPKAYYLFGQTRAGSQRYRCRICSKIFSIKPASRNPIAHHQRSDKNALIFELLCNKMPLRRICEVTETSPRVLYSRIDFLAEQSKQFLSYRESKIEDANIKRLYLGVDRQDYCINWSQRKDKRNVVISAVASADNVSGYVFGMHPNFDPHIDPALVEEDVAKSGDAENTPPFRKYARLWLGADYQASIQRSIKNRAPLSLEHAIAITYDQSTSRQDIESPDVILTGDRLPAHGAYSGLRDR